MQTNQPLIQNDEIDLIELLRKLLAFVGYLKTKKKQLLLSFLIGAFLGLMYPLYNPLTYTATISYVVENEVLDFPEKINSSEYPWLIVNPGRTFLDENLSTLFTSRKMIVNAIEQPVVFNNDTTTLLDEIYLKDDVLKTLKHSKDSLSFTRKKDSLLNSIYLSLVESNIDITQDESLGKLTVTHQNEWFAQQLALNLLKTVEDFYTKTKIKRSKNNLAILQRQRDSIKDILNKNLTAVAVQNDNNFALNPALTAKRLPSIKERVDVKSNTIMLNELIRQTEFAKVHLRSIKPFIQVIDQPIPPLVNNHYKWYVRLLLGGFALIVLYVIFCFLVKLKNKITQLA
ncbi:hypothetical protein SAMN05444278_106119 [Psychroflexus salarius]|uniref:Chain length determinant protein n=1 Tax=Psychroflexus salarius TaxID=1155689 RepID=A0A1M4WQW4_9FLAO|nr:hypothetical protein [Psychroflexus salarius]SHE83604.1 hypothetical protein SAMN05444278_106119 [Psychroflexus salarius]